MVRHQGLEPRTRWFDVSALAAAVAALWVRLVPGPVNEPEDEDLADVVPMYPGATRMLEADQPAGELAEVVYLFPERVA